MNADIESPCGCREFDRIEGAAAQDYLRRFLEKTPTAGDGKYTCLMCRTVWQQVMEMKRPSLIKVSGEELGNGVENANQSGER